jgi:hypothetical protein
MKGCGQMPLTHNNQIELLLDILTNQQMDCCGSIAECEQLERLIKSLMVNTNIHENIKPILQEIYRYSQDGKNSSDLKVHIHSHQNQLSQWIDGMNQLL